MTTYCPALHRLRGAMGHNHRGEPIEPAHRYTTWDGQPAEHCGHCGTTRTETQ